jgi:hypothetical protein
MFGLFGSPPFRDPQLGGLTRSRGHWRGSLSLEAGSTVPLVLSGARSAPDAQAVEIARELPAQFASLRGAIETAVFEHYEPYAEAVEADEPPDVASPRIAAPSQVWPHVSLVSVSVTPLDGALTVEFAYTTFGQLAVGSRGDAEYSEDEVTIRSCQLTHLRTTRGQR